MLSEDKNDRSEKRTSRIHQVSKDNMSAALPLRRIYGVIIRYLITKSNAILQIILTYCTWLDASTKGN
jgi:hypothetical protein